MRIHKKTEIPRQVKNEHFTVDVITCDKDGLINLGYYDFELNKWRFHTDTVSNYNDVDFVWIYPPIERMKLKLS